MPMYSAYDDKTFLLPDCSIRTSTDISLTYSSPWLFAVSHVLLRLSVPRHSPCALCSLTMLLSFDNWDILVLILLSQKYTSYFYSQFAVNRLFPINYPCLIVVLLPVENVKPFSLKITILSLALSASLFSFQGTFKAVQPRYFSLLLS